MSQLFVKANRAKLIPLMKNYFNLGKVIDLLNEIVNTTKWCI
jgi:hypothetical protein